MAWVKWRWIQLIGCMILLVQGEEDYIYNGTINAQVGQNVMLVCFTSATYQKQDLRVFWQRERSQGSSDADVLLNFKKGETITMNQKESYHGRVEVFTDELARGNFSLLLKSVQHEDSGHFEIIIMSNKDTKRERCSIQLNVGAPFSKPRVTVKSHKEFSEVRCETGGGLPEPVIHWTVGNETINSDQVKTNSSITNGSIYVTSILHLKVQGNIPVTCTVENPTLLTNDSSTETVHSYEDPAANLYGLLVLVSVPILLIMAIVVYLFCFSHKKSACRSDQEHPQESTTAPPGGHGSKDNANVTIHLLNME